jgi:hypothetical protein
MEYFTLIVNDYHKKAWEGKVLPKSQLNHGDMISDMIRVWAGGQSWLPSYHCSELALQGHLLDVWKRPVP